MGKLFRPRNVESAFEVIFKTMSVLGLCPFKTKDGHVQISKLRLSWSLFITLMSNGFAGYFIYSPLLIAMNNILVRLIHYFQISAMVSTISLHFGWLLYKRNVLVEVLDELKKIENVIWSDKIRISFLYAIISYITVIVVFVYDGITATTLQDKMIEIGHYILIALNLSTLFFFTALLSVLRNFFCALTVTLFQNELSNKQIDNYLITYDSLVYCCELLNSVFGPQILLTFAFSFVLTISNCYILVLYRATATTVVLSVFWVAMFVSLLGYIIWACSTTMDSGKLFRELFYRKMLKDHSDLLEERLKIALHFISSKPLDFTACHWFSINYNTACAMVAAAATYLIILIQVGGLTVGKPIDLT